MMKQQSVKRTEIAPGVYLNVLTTKKFKTNYFTFNFLSPLSEETASVYALLPYVLKNSNKKYRTRKALSKRLAELYDSALFARVRKIGELQLIGIGSEFLDSVYALDGENLLREQIKLTMDSVFRPNSKDAAFEKKSFAIELANACARRAAQINDKDSYALSRALAECCTGEPYAINSGGELENLEKITPEQLELARNELLRSARIELFFCGSAPASKVASALKGYFSKLQRDPKELVQCRKKQPEQARLIEEKMKINQAKLVMCFNVPACEDMDNGPALKVFSAIYGNGANSRLFLNVREKLSLCYYCSSYIDSSKGLMYITSGLEAENIEAAKQEILSQLSSVQNGDISDDELEAAIKYLIGAYTESKDSPQSVESFAVSSAVSGSIMNLDDYINAFDKVNKNDIVKVSAGISLCLTYVLKDGE